ncbi:MAG: protein kinase domain-containing protein [Desulfurivibrionaceae bacterium]
MDDKPGYWLPRVKSAAENPNKVLKSDNDKLTLKTRLEPWGEVCLQHREWQGYKKQLSFFRIPPGRITWNFSSTLIDLDIPVVEQLLYLEIRDKGFVSHTWQVSQWLEGNNLGKMARDRTSGTEDQIINILEQALLVIASLHGKGFIHGDLKWSNILYVPGHESEIILTDLDHVRVCNSPAAMGRDLARFILSATEFNMAKRVEDKLITGYLKAFRGRAGKVEKSLYKQLARKRGKYEKRRPAAT